jgi:DNA-binding transcriptional LysR family regulator
LVAVAEAGSIGAVAPHLHLSQPQLSRRLSALERRLGTTLLERSTRGTKLTAAGQVVVDWAVVLLDAADEFARSVASLHEAPESNLAISVSMTIAEHLAPSWLGLLHAQDPTTRVSMRVENSAEVVAAVATGKVELGFIETPVPPADLAHCRLGTDRLVVATSPSHPWAAGGTTIDAGVLTHAELLIREPGSGTRQTLDRALAKRGFEVSAGMVMASNAALRSAAIAGVGPVVLSGLAVADDLAAGRLVEIPVTGLDLNRPFSAVWRSESGLTGPAERLLAVAGGSSRPGGS